MLPLEKKPSEYKAVTISYDHHQFLKQNNIDLRSLVAAAIERAMCKKTVTLDRQCIEWIESTDINFDIFVRKQIYEEIDRKQKASVEEVHVNG